MLPEVHVGVKSSSPAGQTLWSRRLDLSSTASSVPGKLAPPTSSLDQLMALFATNGLLHTDMIALSGFTAVEVCQEYDPREICMLMQPLMRQEYDPRYGSVCLDIINQTWSPMFDMPLVVLQVLKIKIHFGALFQRHRWIAQDKPLICYDMYDVYPTHRRFGSALVLRYDIRPGYAHYMAVVQGLVKHGCIPRALEYYDEMKANGFASNPILEKEFKKFLLANRDHSRSSET
ncbi:hypothetical protein ZWY2020_008425 [Hordeum vulgare]|nr:hypothetical protein ZWY2020_008425 [Hordeum vulgare]